MNGASQVVQGLVNRGVPINAAIGLAGNIAVESGFDTSINEINPIVEGSRGGYGLIQWTGPRRRQLEAYAGDKVADLDTQLDFLVHELKTTEKSAAAQIYAAQDPETAARLVSEKFLRPGIPHLDRRIAETRKIAGMAPASPQASPQQQMPQRQNPLQLPFAQQGQQQNALSGQVPQLFSNQLNAQDFYNPTRFNTLTLG